MHGARTGQNAYMLDGTAILDALGCSAGSAQGIVSGIESVQEFTVLTSTYAAEHGRAAGGVFSQRDSLFARYTQNDSDLLFINSETFPNFPNTGRTTRHRRARRSCSIRTSSSCRRSAAAAMWDATSSTVPAC